ncbi:hypothetical protein CK203_090388 [Vitis vinifera]|uniref:Uncharacterized protein n=1 Tax=Vitis vinifera TaxID=29760 RepID=A0A438C7T6_VITVI|nr:hypothetical protein CK203_090388 [Vitis vinifera]
MDINNRTLTLSKATIEASDSFSLHHSQPPEYGTHLKELEGDNYSIWSRGHRLHGKNVKPPNQCHSNANNVNVETNKAVEIEAKYLPTSDGSRLTIEEYDQLMAMIQKNNDGNSQYFANTTEHCYKEMIGLGKQYNDLYYLAQNQNPALDYAIRKHPNLWH